MKSISIGLIFNALDLITGVIVAVKSHDIQSSKLRDGIFKKAGFVICYALAFVIDHFGADIGFQLGVPLLPAVVLYAAGTEIVSIIENVSKLNPDLVPHKLMDLFHVKHEI